MISAEQHIGLVHRLAGVLASNHDEYDELVGVGSIALMNAVSKFDASRGWRFSTFATTVIRHAMWQALNRQPKLSKKMDHRPLCDSLPISGLPRRTDERSTIDEVDLSDSLDRLWDALNQNILNRREREVVVDRFFGNRTLEETGRLLGVTKERVHQIEQDALKKLRAAMEK